jgi:hypothetical protein
LACAWAIAACALPLLNSFSPASLMKDSSPIMYLRWSECAHERAP